MLWMLISASLSINTMYQVEETCMDVQNKLREAGHDAICFQIDTEAQMLQIEYALQSFVGIMKGLENETRR